MLVEQAASNAVSNLGKVNEEEKVANEDTLAATMNSKRRKGLRQLAWRRLLSWLRQVRRLLIKPPKRAFKLLCDSFTERAEEIKAQRAQAWRRFILREKKRKQKERIEHKGVQGADR